MSSHFEADMQILSRHILILSLCAIIYGGCGGRADEDSRGDGLSIVTTPRIKYEKVHALVVGLVSWADPDIASYPKAGRQDEVLAETLSKLGVPRNQLIFL